MFGFVIRFQYFFAFYFYELHFPLDIDKSLKEIVIIPNDNDMKFNAHTY